MTLSAPRHRCACSRQAHRQSGVVLAISLLLLLVLTVLAMAGMQAATIELQMAAAEQHQQRAFQAAEAGIEQAIAAGDFTLDPAAAAACYNDPASPEPTLIPGTGTPITACPHPSGDPAGRCEYCLRFDAASGVTPVPGTGQDVDMDLRAYHFVIDAVGIAGRGARSEHTQSIYVVGPATQLAACQANRAECALEAARSPVRTYWRQRGTD
jgi:type IV pilus assembly protein PilX